MIKNRIINVSIISIVAVVGLMTTVLGIKLNPAKPAKAVTTFTVINGNDSGAGSLRQAIEDANANPGADVINFEGPLHIQLTADLPNITEQVTIDGYDDGSGSATPNTITTTDPATGTLNGVITIEVDCTNNSQGLVLDGADGSIVKGLAINSCTWSGIVLNNTDNAQIVGNYIGTDTTGAVAKPNAAGITLQSNSANNIIGGTNPADRNVISGNTNGYALTTDGEGNPAGTGNVVQGNYIGLANDGTTTLPNDYGIGGFDANGMTVGGTSDSARNVVSGNTHTGITIAGNTDDGISNNAILGNYIGTDYTGTLAKGNEDGINMNGGNGANNFIGGTVSGSRNIISGNNATGIGETFSVTVQGNYIGLASDGSALGNGVSTPSRSGISIGGSGSVVGGTTLAARNYISAQIGGMGLTIVGLTIFGDVQASNVTVQGNCIGTNANCEVEAGFGNEDRGMTIFADVDNVLIGGTEPGAGNVIAGNGGGIANLGLQTTNPLNISILGNSIYANSGSTLTDLGIDNLQTEDFVNWINAGVTANDPNDIDYDGENTGPNHYLNFPELTSVTSTDGTATITYNLDINDTEAGATGYRVEFFANDTADASGHGQGQTYLGSDTVSGDVTARQATITLPTGVGGSKQISAVTIMIDESADGFGHSSEFAADIAANLVAKSGVTPSSASLASTGQNSYVFALISILALSTGGYGLFRSLVKKQR